MGAGNEEAEGWLDICRDIASSTDSDDQFIRMISDLVKLSLETGMNLKDLIKDYHEKLSTLPELNREIEQKKEELNKIEVKCEKEKDQAGKELDSLTQKISVARENSLRPDSSRGFMLNSVLLIMPIADLAERPSGVPTTGSGGIPPQD